MGDRIATQVQLPVLAYRLVFRDPIFNLEELDDSAVSAAFAAFRPWNVSLENIKVKEDPANFSEEATEFTLLGGRITFSITPGGCAIAMANPNWSEADLIIQIGNAGIAAVLKATGAVPDKQVATITMHLTPQTGTIAEITSKFVKLDLGKITGAPAQSFGFSVYREDLLWVVDRSGAFPNSLFFRMDRWFRGDMSLEQVAHQLNADEITLLEMLGLEVS